MSDDRRPTGEKGSVLIMALVFVTVVSLVVLALLGLVETNLRVTTAVRDHQDHLYAADAGLQHAIESMRLDRTLCGAVSTDPTPLTSVVIDGTTVDLECRTVAGGSSGASGWAVIAHASPGITTDGSSSDSRYIDGPVFAAGLDDFSPSLTVRGGSVIERQGTGCTTVADRPSGLVIEPNPPYTYLCENTEPPDPVHTLPIARPADAPAPFDDPSDGLDCQVFFPGTYTAATAPDLDDNLDHYFVSGTYYFENIGEMEVSKADVQGGERDPLETRVNSGSSDCDGYVEHAAYPGTGVKWIFGGNSWLDVANQGRIELFSRTGGSMSEGQSGISFHAVTSSEAGVFMASTRGLSERVVEVSGGSTAEMAVHGMVYAPQSFIDFFATNDSDAQLRGGVVVGRLNMQASASASGLVVSVRDAPVVRQVVVTATARGDAVGEVAVEAEAVLTMQNDEDNSFSITSWRTGRTATPAPPP